RSEMGRSTRSRQRRALERGHSRGLAMAPVGSTRSRSAIRIPHASEQPCGHALRHAVARAGHRREHRIFSLMEAALWKPMAVRDPQQLRLFTWTTGPHGLPDSTWGDWSRGGPHHAVKSGAGFSSEVFEALERNAPACERVVAFKLVGRVTALVDDQAELVVADLVSGGVYEGLRVVR